MRKKKTSKEMIRKTVKSGPKRGIEKKRERWGLEGRTKTARMGEVEPLRGGEGINSRI